MSSSLPHPLTSFVGRERELERLKTLLLRTRLLTLTGPGGSGKTRLAIRLASDLASRFEHGVEFVPLASVLDSGLVFPTVARVLGLPEIGRREPIDVLREYLEARQLLLVLDNFEQLVSAGPRLVELLGCCPKLTILVTSRFALRVSGEQEYAVPPLSLPDATLRDADLSEPLAALQCSEAAQLFLERARAVQSDFTVSGSDAGALADVCRRLDGLPLAIELAAARVRLLPPASLAAHLAGPTWRRDTGALPLLVDGARDLPERQQTLRATIAWSYDLLSASEQALFRYVSVFCGGATLSAIQACTTTSGIVDCRWAAAPDEVLRDVEALIAKSLLERRSGPLGEPRFVLLETIREFGLERLAESGELEAMRRWHAGYYLALAELAEPLLRGAEQRFWLDRLESEHDNLRAALEWAVTTHDGGESAARLAGALAWFWLDRGYASEGRAWVERALGVGRSTPVVCLKVLCGAAWLAHVQRDALAACRYLDTAQALATEQNDRWTLAWTSHLRGRVAYFDGDVVAAQECGQHSLALARETDDPWLIAWALHLLGLAAHISGSYPEARAYYEEALAIRRQLGYLEGIGICLNLLAMVAYRQGELPSARALAHESLVDLWDIEAQWTVHNPLVTLTVVAAAAGQAEQSVRLAAATQAFSELVDVSPIPLAEKMLGDALAAVRTQLGEARYSAAWTEGRLLALDDAIAEALAVSNAPDPGGSTTSGPLSTLSSREHDVLRLIIDGYTSKEIAQALAISVTTVERHITHVYEKLGVRSRAEATSYALRNGVA
jgi:non-specific serine/threonine protein kinase